MNSLCHSRCGMVIRGVTETFGKPFLKNDQIRCRRKNELEFWTNVNDDEYGTIHNTSTTKEYKWMHWGNKLNFQAHRLTEAWPPEGVNAMQWSDSHLSVFNWLHIYFHWFLESWLIGYFTELRHGSPLLPSAFHSRAFPALHDIVDWNHFRKIGTDHRSAKKRKEKTSEKTTKFEMHRSNC